VDSVSPHPKKLSKKTIYPAHLAKICNQPPRIRDVKVVHLLHRLKKWTASFIFQKGLPQVLFAVAAMDGRIRASLRMKQLGNNVLGLTGLIEWYIGAQQVQDILEYGETNTRKAPRQIFRRIWASTNP
jgi:hypothetical protein